MTLRSSTIRPVLFGGASLAMAGTVALWVVPTAEQEVISANHTVIPEASTVTEERILTAPPLVSAGESSEGGIFVQATEPVTAPATDSLPWITVSSDGYFRYRFFQSVDDSAEPGFVISTDGEFWEDALVLDVWRVDRRESRDEFEAILAPPRIAVPRILVNEVLP